MANASVTQLITRQTVGQALAQARQDCVNSTRWLNAVNKAAVELDVPGSWQFDGETLRITSASNPNTRYTIDAHGCSCPAGARGKPCKHRAAWRLLLKAGEIAQQPTHRHYTDAEYARIQAAADELF